jgi:hypothetical protein
VRAGQPVVEQEIAACGFRKVKQIPNVLQENYFVIFEKAADAAPGRETK